MGKVRRHFVAPMPGKQCVHPESASQNLKRFGPPALNHLEITDKKSVNSYAAACSNGWCFSDYVNHFNHGDHGAQSAKAKQLNNQTAFALRSNNRVGKSGQVQTNATNTTRVSLVASLLGQEAL